MLIKKITKKRISLDSLTKILKTKGTINHSQSISSVLYVKTSKNIIITCTENLEIAEPKVFEILTDKIKIAEILQMPIGELDISSRVLTILKSRDLETVGQVKSIGEKSLRKSRGFGDRAALDVRLALNQLGLNFDEPKD